MTMQYEIIYCIIIYTIIIYTIVLYLLNQNASYLTGAQEKPTSLIQNKITLISNISGHFRVH